jgi:hypothetical protein
MDLPDHQAGVFGVSLLDKMAVSPVKEVALADRELLEHVVEFKQVSTRAARHDATSRRQT